MSESSLVEDSTSTKLTSTLENYLKKLDETTIHHEYMIALFIVLLSESGFYVLPMSEASFSKNEKLIYTSPKQWKTMKDIYEIKLVLKYLPHVICKLVAISSGDRLIVNFFSTTGEKNVYSIAIQSLKYVNPFSNNFASRYMNLKEISHRFKDALVMRVRADILTEAGLINPSFQGLPTELKLKILGMLEASTLMQVSQCSRHFNVLCKEPLLWQALLRRDFAEKQVKSDRSWISCYRMRYIEHNRKRHHNISCSSYSSCSSCKPEIDRYHPSWIHPRVDIPSNIGNYHIPLLSDFLRLHGSSRQSHLDFGNLFRYRFGSRFGR
ncbi:F-box only protein 7 isoform X1 [Vespa velutina]|uniref:F-box only protein 7 isoform X1 n=1 Tax=Vespa velutina TaxID=202808 RepID=UPI001FB2B3C8|nr:F-box only protein 7 isoform X1 [Vespa velutina]